MMSSRTVWVCRVPGGSVLDTVVVEEPLDIRVEGETFAVTMRTPGQDLELAAGLLRAEGVIRTVDDVLVLAQTETDPHGNTVDVRLAPGVPRPDVASSRARFATSACGLCGIASVERLHRNYPPALARLDPNAEWISTAPATVAAAQPLFHQTGGIHGAALFDAEGRLLVAREDVGRHNAVDKAIGWALLEDRPLAGASLFVTSRIGYELVEKAVVAGLSGVVGLGAATTLAVDLAAQQHMTLIGFLRHDRQTRYA